MLFVVVAKSAWVLFVVVAKSACVRPASSSMQGVTFATLWSYKHREPYVLTFLDTTMNRSTTAANIFNCPFRQDRNN